MLLASGFTPKLSLTQRRQLQPAGASVVATRDQARALEAGGELVHRLPRYERAACELGLREIWPLGEQLKTCVLRHAQPVRAQPCLESVVQRRLGTLEDVPLRAVEIHLTRLPHVRILTYYALSRS